MANKKDSLGDRMKGYENISRNHLTRRVPVIIRLDGKAFHTFTRGLEKPFDNVMVTAMQNTMKYLCENIQGCVLGYTQSDEITLVLTDYATIATDSWFGYNIQKMCSVSASMATLAFNRFFAEAVCDRIDNDKTEPFDSSKHGVYMGKLNKAMFDSRVFSIPKEEVCNCLIWRQQDATRNSIEAVGQANFSHSQLHKKTCNDIQEMLWSQKGINWNDFPDFLKRGSCCYKTATVVHTENGDVERHKWVVDLNPPIFTQNREYVEVWL